MAKKLIWYIVRARQVKVVRNEENLLHARGSGLDFGAASEIRRGEARDSPEGGFPRASIATGSYEKNTFGVFRTQSFVALRLSLIHI